jgi:phage FluMu protein Com
VATVIQVAIRCAGCHRRLADVVNEVEAGQVLLELKCPRCGQPHLEVIRPQRTDTPPKASSASRIGTGLGLVLAVASSLWALALLLSLVLMIATSVFPRAASGASAEPHAEVTGEAITSEPVENGVGGPLRTLEKLVCDLPPQTDEAMKDERLLARDAAKRGVMAQARVGTEVGGTAATVGDTEADAFCSGQEVLDG